MQASAPTSVYLDAQPTLVLTTVAGAAGALAAILGGFLVVRAANVRQQREQRTEDVHEAERFLHDAEQEVSKLETALEAAQRCVFMEEVLPELVRQRGASALTTLRKKYDSPLTQEALEPEFNRVREIIARGFEAMTSLATSPPNDSMESADLPVPATRSDREYFDLVWRSLRAGRKVNPQADPREALTHARRASALQARYQQRQDAAREALTRAEESLTDGLAEVEYARAMLAGRKSALSRVPRPRDAHVAYVVLALFAFINIVVPMLFLANAPLEGPSWLLNAFVGSFTLGMAAVFVSLWVLIAERPEGGWLSSLRRKRGKRAASETASSVGVVPAASP